MHLRLSISYILAFTLLLIVMMELHEVAHISVGRIICGCWGPRDFNVWSLCPGCEENHPPSWLATLAGPVFSFVLMWLGMSWIRSYDKKKQALGFSLIFSNIPFGRITTVMMGGGDEMVVIRHFFKNDFTRTEMIVIGSVLLLIVALPPIIRAYTALTNARAWLYIVGFLTLPLLFLLIYTLGGLNTLLGNGFLSTNWIMGTPLLITIHTIIAVVLLALFQKNLFLINK